MQPTVNIEAVSGDRLSALDVYQVWGVRDAVFAFEQHVEDVDVDGLDLRTDTTHVLIRGPERIVSYLRVLTEGDEHRIGRVCTRVDARGRGLAGALMSHASELFDPTTLRLNAQAHLERWYESLDYARYGPNFIEAGIVHVPMAHTLG